jgi:hypothetical protein
LSLGWLVVPKYSLRRISRIRSQSVSLIYNKAFHRSNRILDYLERPVDLAGVGIGILHPVNLPVCLECQYCIQSVNLYAHIHSHKLATKAGFTKATQEAVIQKHHLSLLASKPEDGGPILPGLKQVEGSMCPQCPFKSTSAQSIQRHASVHKTSQGLKTKMTPVLLQTFFAPSSQSLEDKSQTGGYIQVQRSQSHSRKKPSDFIPDMLKAQEDTYDPPIIDQEDPRTVAPFAHITEWALWVNLYPAAVLRQLRDKETKWKILPGMVNDCLALFAKSKELCVFGNSGIRCHLAASKYVIPYKHLAKALIIP